MKKIFYIIMILMILSCNQKEKNILQGKLWVSDYKTEPELLFFDKNECIRLTSDFENFNKILIDTLNWKLVDDSLELSSRTNTSKFKIKTYNKNSLTLHLQENSYTNSVTYYAIERNNQKYNVNLTREFFNNNSLKAKSSISEKEYFYVFITEDKCINQFDSLNFQLEHWEIQEFDDEIFFISRSPTFSVFFHLEKLNNEKAEFKYYYHGKHDFSFNKTDNKVNNQTNNLLVNKWFHKVFDTIPLPLTPPDYEKKKFIEGIYWEFRSDNSYIHKERFITKSGNWKLIFDSKYILIDDFENEKSVMQISEIDSNYLKLIYRNEMGETYINEFEKIE